MSALSATVAAGRKRAAETFAALMRSVVVAVASQWQPVINGPNPGRKS